jgi:hypothetical protein
VFAQPAKGVHKVRPYGIPGFRKFGVDSAGALLFNQFHIFLQQHELF